jgi:hypothetical protein
MNKTEIFWKWFLENKSKFDNINNLNEEETDYLLEEMLDELKKYSNGVFFEIGGHPDEFTKELIFTAEGDLEYFDDVELLVKAAPQIDKWEIIAFKQPLNEEFATNWHGIKLNTEEMFFKIVSDEETFEDGVKICLSNYDKVKNEEMLETIVLKMLDSIIGEVNLAKKIDYIEISGYDRNDLEQRPVNELLKYIDEKQFN